MLAIGNDELEAAPELGETVKCWMCGKEHLVVYGTETLEDGTRVPYHGIAFFNCGGKQYVCGVKGKEWRPRGVR